MEMNVTVHQMLAIVDRLEKVRDCLPKSCESLNSNPAREALGAFIDVIRSELQSGESPSVEDDTDLTLDELLRGLQSLHSEAADLIEIIRDRVDSLSSVQNQEEPW